MTTLTERAAPDWAHRLLDLAWGDHDPEKIKPGGSLYTYMPTGDFWMRQWSVPGAAFSAGFEYSRETFHVDFRENKTGKWTVTTAQKQPDPVPAISQTLQEWLTERTKS